jgi:hypothetical protein
MLLCTLFKFQGVLIVTDPLGYQFTLEHESPKKGKLFLCLWSSVIPDTAVKGEGMVAGKSIC